MTGVSVLGIISNVCSLLFFLQQKYHKTFHRYPTPLQPPLTGYHRVSRLLLLLGLVDTLHLVTSLITFSLPTLAPSLGESASVIRWSLPIAQVSSGQITGKIIQLIQELYGDVCLHDNIHDCREVSFYCSPTLHSEKQVRILKNMQTILYC